MFHVIHAISYATPPILRAGLYKIRMGPEKFLGVLENVSGPREIFTIFAKRLPAGAVPRSPYGAAANKSDSRQAFF